MTAARSDLLLERGQDTNSSDCLDAILDFCRTIGIPPVPRRMTEPKQGLTGVSLASGQIQYDPDGLGYPGDVLYLAATLALCHPDQRSNLSSPLHFSNESVKVAHSMATAAWCYAACKAIGIPGQTVFHDGGYQGQGDWLAQSFEGGQYFGLPMLQLFGMAYDAGNAQAKECQAYPAMTLWLRSNDIHSDIDFFPDVLR